MILWNAFFYAWIVSEIVIAVVTRTAGKSGEVQDRGTQLILWVVVFSSITACEFIRHLVTQPSIFGPVSWLGLLSVWLLAAGLAVRWIAILTLGKSFSANVAIKSSQTIQRDGIYRFIRHPSYLGMLIIFSAIGLRSNNWLGLAVVLFPTTAALLYRIRIEEAALRRSFGDDYVSYSKATKRLIPGVY